MTISVFCRESVDLWLDPEVFRVLFLDAIVVSMYRIVEPSRGNNQWGTGIEKLFNEKLCDRELFQGDAFIK